MHARISPGDAREAGAPAGPARVELERADVANVLDSLPIVAYERDVASGHVLFVNRRAERVFGHPLARFREPGFWDDVLVHPSDRGRAMRAREVGRGGARDGYTSEYRVRTASGRVLWVREQAVLRGRDAGPVRIHGVLIDITDAKRLEGIVDERQRRIDAILDHTADGIFGIDARGKITFANAVCAAMLGYAPPELRGRSEQEIVHPRGTNGLPSASAQCPIFAVQTSGQARRLQGAILHRKDGSRLAADCTITPILEAGRFTGAVVSFRDVSDREAIERELERRERDLASAQRLAGLGAWEWDLASDRAFWSEAIYAIVGLDAGAVAPSHAAYLRCVDPDDAPRFDAVVRAAIEAGRGGHDEHRVIRPDGSVRMIRAAVDVERGATAEVTRVRGFVQDVTEALVAERQRAELLASEREAKRAERRVREVLEAIPQQVWVADACGAVRMVNERVSTYFDRGFDHLAGPALRDSIHPDDYEAARAAWRRARLSRTTLGVEIRLRRADGTYLWHLCRAEPQLGPTGRVERWIGTNTDLTAVREARAERDRAEREARLERERLRTIFERAPAAIGITRGAEHVLVAANAAFRALAPERDPVGRSIRDALPELGEHSILGLIGEVFSSGRAHVGRAPIRRGGEDEAYLNYVLQPLAGADGVEGVLFHAVDVSDMVYARLAVEEKAAELEELTGHLESANEELDRFAYVTSHDLRAPLRGIGNLAQWIEEDLAGDIAPHTKHHLELLRARVTRLERLIDGILSYSRAGRGVDTLERIDVGRLVDDLVDLLDPPPDARIEVGPMPHLFTERVPLAQVLQNLLANAITHGRSPRGPRVRVAAERVGSLHHFSVSDEGPGIDPRFHGRIFGIFQTLTGEGDRRAGIGLSLVRKIVEGRGGQVSVESKPGLGATFRFTWPEKIGRRRSYPSETFRAMRAPPEPRGG